jgi:hypothetical protein
MDIIQQIGLQVVEILTLVFGILGVTFSLLLMYSPNLTKSIGSVFNRYVDIDDKVTYLDKDFRIDSYFYRHNIIFGTCLAAGSVFSLIFFFFKLDVSGFANIFFVSHRHLSTNEMIFSAVSWVGKVACFFGIFFGTMLFFAPNKMRKLATKLNFWFDTRHVFDKLDDSNRELDTILFRRPMFFGAVGLIVSLFIIVLSILNLIS